MWAPGRFVPVPVPVRRRSTDRPSYPRRVAGFGRWIAARPSLDAAEIDRQERSWAELAAGRLPLGAQERLAAQTADEVFTSDLSTRDLVAIRAAGYEPVGQAFGTATYGISNRMQSYARYSVHPYPYGYRASGPFGNSYSPGLPVNAKRLAGFHDGANTARGHALRRMMIECAGLGADGVLGVRVVRSSPAHGLFEFTVIGTAVRRVQGSSAATAAPFSTTLSAVDVGVLQEAGWRPVALLYELQRYGGHAGWIGGGGARLNPLSYGSGEVEAGSVVSGLAGRETRARLEARLPAGGGMVLDSYRTEVERDECIVFEGSSDLVVDVEAIGTAIERIPDFRRRPRPALDVLPVVRLS